MKTTASFHLAALTLGAIVAFTVGNPGFGALGVVAVAVGAVKLCMTRQE